MIIIKNNYTTKVILLVVIFSGIGISVLPFAAAYVPPKSYFPKAHYELYGSCVYGTLNSFKYKDGDAMKWEAELNIYRFYFIFIPTWELCTTMAFDCPTSASYENVVLYLKFRWDGGAFAMTITVYYVQGGVEVFGESSTGGTYKSTGYILDPYKTVEAVNFDSNAPYGSQTFLYIDYMKIGYYPSI